MVAEHRQYVAGKADMFHGQFFPLWAGGDVRPDELTVWVKVIHVDPFS